MAAGVTPIVPPKVQRIGWVWGIPHLVVRRSSVPAIVGEFAIGRPFAAWTIWFLTFVPGNEIRPNVHTHERQHVLQFVACLYFALGVCVITTPALAWWVAPLFAFSLVYGLESGRQWIRKRHPYRDNLFEVNARQVAGEK